MTDDEAQRTLALASEVAAALRARRVKTALVGAGAMAVHNYSRQTEDLDLAVSEPLERFRKLADDLRRCGFQVEMAEPDAQDPLGGVLTISRADTSPVQIVNFDNSAFSAGHPRLGRLAVTTAESHPDLPAPLRVVRLPVLIALKLYAGGPKSELDVLELLDRNRLVDLESLRTLCADLGLGDRLDALLARMH
jgi:hypothetical protein